MKQFNSSPLLRFRSKTFRLLAIAVFLVSFYLPALAQQKTFTFDLQNQTLKQIFKTIEKQSEYRFMYNDALIDVNQKTDCKVNQAVIDKVLDQLFDGKDIAFTIQNNQIVLSKKVHETEKNLSPEKKLIKGTVVDEKNLPLPGVNVVIKGTAIGTITDFDGNFSIEIGSVNTVLVFSYIGFKIQEFTVGEKTVININLEPDLKGIDEVVVIGYGTSSKKLLTGSVSSVKAEELRETASLGIESALQGKTSGVQIVQNSGTPGAAVSVKIRGAASLFSGTQPLYVIDGVPMITGDYSQVNFEGQGIDASSDLNPNDIESISILKDASAAAIYGARAANGVVLITTKKGKSGDSKISFSGYSGLQKEWKRLDMMNAQEWRDYVRTFDPVFVNSLDTTIDTDWQDEVFRLAPMNNYELSFSGGNEKTKVYASGGYFNQMGIVLGSDYKKYSGRMNVDHQLSDKLNIGLRVGMNYSINNRIVGDQSINGVLPNAISKPPVYPVYDSLGNYLETGFWDNPVAIGNEVTNEARTNRTLASVDVGYKVLPDLEINYQGGTDFYNLHEMRYEPTTVRRGALSNGIAIDARSTVMTVTHQVTLNYNKTFMNHNLTALFGISSEDFNEWYSWLRGSNFASDELRYINEAGNKEETSSKGGKETLNSLFGRLKYNYADKYLAEFSMRRDGSSKFGTNNSYAVLPALSLAYRMNEEPFMKDIWFIDELKFKVGLGLTGNDQIPRDRFRNLYLGGANYSAQPGLIPRQIPNPNLKWETTTNFNIGTDLGLFNNRIFFAAEYYHNNTTDLLMPRPIAPSSGFSSFMDNVGNLTNKGFEFTLNTTNIKSEFEWNTSLNISFNRNKITRLYNNQPFTDQGRGGNSAIEEEPIGIFYMVKSLGVDPSTGDLVFEDLNKDKQLNDADRQIVGDPNPDFTGGVTNIFRYKGFDLRVFFQFSYGNDIFNGTRQYAEAMKFGTSDNQLVTINDRWVEPGQLTYIPRHDGTNNLFPLSSHYIEDGSYLRLKELTLGYNFSDKLIRRIKNVSSIRLYLKMQNLLTFTNYSGLDPEVNYSGNSNLVQGTDFFTYPLPRSFMIGFNLDF